MKQRIRFPLIAGALLLLTTSALLAIGWHWLTLRTQLQQAERAARAAQDLSARSLLKGFSLPVNKSLRLCNQSGAGVTVTALTATYWTQDGKIGEFNSAEHGWHQWELERGQSQSMQLKDGTGDPWDGAAIFYAVEVKRSNGAVNLLTGNSDTTMGDPCVAIPAE